MKRAIALARAIVAFVQMFLLFTIVSYLYTAAQRQCGCSPKTEFRFCCIASNDPATTWRVNPSLSCHCLVATYQQPPLKLSPCSILFHQELPLPRSVIYLLLDGLLSFGVSMQHYPQSCWQQWRCLFPHGDSLTLNKLEPTITAGYQQNRYDCPCIINNPLAVSVIFLFLS